MVMISWPLRDLGKLSAKAVSKAMAVPVFAAGKYSVSNEPMFCKVAFSCVTAGMAGAALTVTTTMEFEVDLPHATPPKAASSPRTNRARFMGTPPACRVARWRCWLWSHPWRGRRR